MTEASHKDTSNRAAEQELSALLNRVDELDDLLQKNKNPRFAKLGAWAGILALAITILVGGLDIIDRTVGKKIENSAANVSAAKAIAHKISGLNQEMTRLSAEGKFLELNSKSGMIAAEKMSLLNEFESLDRSVASKLGSADLIIFSTEYLMHGNESEAIKLSETALLQADSVYLKSQSLQTLARSYFIPGQNQDLGEARDLTEKAIAETKTLKNSLMYQMIFGIYTNWLVTEAQLLECDNAKLVYEDYKNFALTSPLNAIQPFNDTITRQQFSQISSCNFE